MENKRTFVLTAATLALVAILFAYVLIAGVSRAVPAVSSGEAAGGDSVEVYGQGKVYISPDVAYITLGYQNTDIDPQKAQDENAAKISKIIAAVKSAGIPDADIQTSQYSVNTDYYSDGKSIKGFIVTNTASVTVRDVGKAGGIIKTGYDAGANLFYGIRFDLLKRQDAYLSALAIALDRAKEKAAKLASDSGRSLGAVISMRESQVSDSPYYYSQYSNFAMAPAVSGGAGGAGTISSGQLEITAVVTVTYKLN